MNIVTPYNTFFFDSWDTDKLVISENSRPSISVTLPFEALYGWHQSWKAWKGRQLPFPQSKFDVDFHSCTYGEDFILKGDSHVLQIVRMGDSVVEVPMRCHEAALLLKRRNNAMVQLKKFTPLDDTTWLTVTTQNLTQFEIGYYLNRLWDGNATVTHPRSNTLGVTVPVAWLLDVVASRMRSDIVDAIGRVLPSEILQWPPSIRPASPPMSDWSFKSGGQHGHYISRALTFRIENQDGFIEMRWDDLLELVAQLIQARQLEQVQKATTEQILLSTWWHDHNFARPTHKLG